MVRTFILAAVLVGVSCSPFERNNPFDPGSDSYQPVPHPAKPTLGAVTFDYVYIEWPAVDGAVGYEVTRHTSPDGAQEFSRGIDATHFEDQDLVPNTTYYYRVKAVFAGNVISAPSDAVTVPVPPAPPVRLIFPVGGEVLRVGQQVTIEWDVLEPTIELVVVRLSIDGGNSWEILHQNPLERVVHEMTWTPQQQHKSDNCILSVNSAANPDMGARSQRFEIIL